MLIRSTSRTTGTQAPAAYRRPAQVHIFLVDDLLTVDIDVGIEHWMPPQSDGHGLHDKRHAVSLRFAPSHPLGTLLRMLSRSVISASSKFVTWGTVVQERDICAAIVLRIFDIRSRRTEPYASWAGSPGGTTGSNDTTGFPLAPAAGATAGAALASAAACRTSSGVIRARVPSLGGGPSQRPTRGPNVAQPAGRGRPTSRRSFAIGGAAVVGGDGSGGVLAASGTWLGLEVSGDADGWVSAPALARLQTIGRQSVAARLQRDQRLADFDVSPFLMWTSAPGRLADRGSPRPPCRLQLTHATGGGDLLAFSTSTLTTSPLVMFSPSSGSLKSMLIESIAREFEKGTCSAFFSCVCLSHS